MSYPFFKDICILALPGGSGEPTLRGILHMEACWQIWRACSWIWQDDLCKEARWWWHHSWTLPESCFLTMAEPAALRRGLQLPVSRQTLWGGVCDALKKGWLRLCYAGKSLTAGLTAAVGFNSWQVAGFTSQARSLMRHKCPSSCRLQRSKENTTYPFPRSSISSSSSSSSFGLFPPRSLSLR